jgi:phenylglyoxylate dehydrogenase alpha subunit
MTRDLVDIKKAFSYIVDISKPEVVASTSDGFSRYVPKLQKNILQLYSDKATMNTAMGANSFGSRTLAILDGNGVSKSVKECKKLGLPIVILAKNYSTKDCVQIYVSSLQELTDTALQSFSIAENKDILLPVELVIDPELSNTNEVVDLPQKTTVKNLLPNYRPDHITLNPKKPECLNTVEHNGSSVFDDEKIFSIISAVAKDFKKKVGIDLGNGITESYDVKGSSKVIVTYGTLFRKIKQHLNENKIKDYSVIRVRCINPFPKDHVAELCSNFDSVIVVEKKDLSFFSQVKQSLKDKKIDKLNYKGYEDLLKLK